MKTNSFFRCITLVCCARINSGTCRFPRVGRHRNGAFQVGGTLGTATHRTLTLALVAPLLTILLVLSTGCGSLGKGSSAPAPTTQYQASLYTPQGDALVRQIVVNLIYGQISVESNGAVTVQLTGANASTAFTVQFCPAPSENYKCFYVGSLSSDANGNANTTMTFPKSGSWAGDFELLSGGTAAYQTDLQSGNGSPVYMSTLQPVSTVNGRGLGVSEPPQDPLSSGRVTFSNGSLQFQMTGASSSTSYNSAECALNLESSCDELYDGQGTGGFRTDGSGSVTFSVLQNGSGGDIFVVTPPSGSGFVGGFTVSSGN